MPAVQSVNPVLTDNDMRWLRDPERGFVSDQLSAQWPLPVPEAPNSRRLHGSEFGLLLDAIFPSVEQAVDGAYYTTMVAIDAAITECIADVKRSNVDPLLSDSGRLSKAIELRQAAARKFEKLAEPLRASIGKLIQTPALDGVRAPHETVQTEIRQRLAAMDPAPRARRVLDRARAGDHRPFASLDADPLGPDALIFPGELDHSRRLFCSWRAPDAYRLKIAAEQSLRDIDQNLRTARAAIGIDVETEVTLATEGEQRRSA